eukprot:3260485-Pyramimonas_sp.AAC.1
MNFTAASEATPSFGSHPSGSVHQPGLGFRRKHLWCRLPVHCANQGVQYINVVSGTRFASLHRLPTTGMFEIPTS